jgi:predicted Zn-dependent peptidase
MTSQSFFVRVVTITLCFLGSAAIGAAREDFKDIESRVSEFTLQNGWKFIVLERHQAPVASFLTYADVGSTQEVTGISGLAHMFEHMAFKGSSTVGTTDYAREKPALAEVDRTYHALFAERMKGRPADATRLKQLEADFKAAQEAAEKFVRKNEFGEAVERAGGRDLNATTAEDRTIYYFSLPSNETELWFNLEAQRFSDPVLRQFYKERDVVMEERRLGESEPIARLLQEFQAVAYKAHPYRDPVIGHMSDLQSFSREDAVAFFKKYYTPANLISVVAGDVDPRRIRELAEAYFGGLPGGPKPEPLHTVEPPQLGERRLTLRLQSQRLFLEGYHKPDINDPDNAVYDAIGSLLSDGRSSRLFRTLVRDQKIATNAGGFPGFPGQKYPGLFLFYAFPSPGHTNEEVQKSIEAEIERLKTEPVASEELDGVKRRARANLIQQLDDNSTLAYLLAEAQALNGDWRELFRRLDKISALTPADIQRVAKAAFVFDNRTIGVIEPVEEAAK